MSCVMRLGLMHTAYAINHRNERRSGKLLGDIASMLSAHECYVEGNQYNANTYPTVGLVWNIETEFSSFLRLKHENLSYSLFDETK